MEARANTPSVAGELQAASAAREFLTFGLGEEEYGVDILKVQEIRGYDTVTRIPEAPDYVKGVVNLRGTIVPVVDLRVRFGLPEARYDAFTVMILLNVGERVVGVVVDRVSEVTALPPDRLYPPPELGGAIDAAYITGLGSVDERMLILIDTDALIGGIDDQLPPPKPS